MIDTGDTAWMLISTALVFLMVPGVGFFYGGMLRKESFLSILGQTVIITGMVTLIWVIFGYSLAFGGFHSDLIGNLDFLGMKGVGQLPDTNYAATIPAILYSMYQLMFAIVTVCLIIGGVAGLVAITPASGFVDTTGAIAIGIGAGVICYGGILARRRLGFDDTLDVWGVHGIGGTFGAIATGLFASHEVNGAVNINHQGLFIGGDFTLLSYQLIAVAVVWALAFGVTFIVLKVLGKITQLRMTKDEERIGADIIQHGESAYS
jgi:ammonia channel protein AmtB